MGRYFQGGDTFVWVIMIESEYTQTDTVVFTVPQSVCSLDVSLAVLFHTHPLFFSQSRHSATVLLTLHTRTNIIVIAVSTCVCYGVTLKFTPGAILVWVITIES